MGGVVTSERAWTLCRKLKTTNQNDFSFDVSSYEYAISLLCQALRTREGESRINEMKAEFDVGEKLVGVPQSVSESLSFGYLALARAHALLGMNDDAVSACQMSLRFMKASRDSLHSGIKSEVGGKFLLW